MREDVARLYRYIFEIIDNSKSSLEDLRNPDGTLSQAAEAIVTTMARADPTKTGWAQNREARMSLS